jgi:hypothetical protein
MPNLAEAVPREALELRESVSLEPVVGLTQGELSSLLEANGIDPSLAEDTVPIYVIRPGVGRGRGKHLYEAEMLEQNAGVFKGWKMYVDHESPEAQRKKGGLPRSVRDLGGIIKESFWHGGIPPDPERGHGQGAVIGLTKPTPLIRELVDTDPALVEASIRAHATGVRPVQRGREQVWLVEGIQPRGSVDWVTEAGAGGRVAALMEATLDETLMEAAELRAEMMSEMEDPKFGDWLQSERPELYQALVEERDEEDEVPLTPEALQEALSTDEGKSAVQPIISELVAAGIEEQLPSLLESALTDERQLMEHEARAHADRAIWVRDARDKAHGLIDNARLPEAYAEDLKSRYDLVEGRPTAGLDVIDEIDGEGQVVKKADTILEEAIAEEIGKARRLLAAARPARVTGSGSTRTAEEGEGKEGETSKKKTSGSVMADDLLMEAGIPEEELDAVYQGIF